MYVLGVMINNPDYAYSKRLVYIDATPLDQGGNFPLIWGEQYDQKGRLWKVSSMFNYINSEGFKVPIVGTYLNYQTDHYTIMDAIFTVRPLTEDEAAFDIKTLLKRAQ